MVQGINGFESGRDQFIQKLQAAGITQEELQTAHTQGPEAFMQLLKSHGIQAPPPPPSDTEKDEFMKKLEAAGITKEEFQAAFMQGPEAVRKLLESHGIQPPNSEADKFSHNGIKHSHRSGNRAQFIQKLQAIGITHEEFETARANGTVNELLKQHGITL